MGNLWRAMAIAAALGVAGFGPAMAEDKGYPLDVAIGKADAPTTVIEYFSLDCPHCARFYAEVYPKLKTDWVDTGKIKWVLRDFPLHDIAQAAAMIAHCSGDRYIAFVDAFFRTQESWGTAEDPIAAIKTIAALGGMGGAAVDACLANNDLVKQMNARVEDGQKDYKLSATPTFVINGTVIQGERSYDEFVKLLPAGK